MDFKRHGIACGVEPLTTPVHMPPALQVQTFWVLALEQVSLELLIGRAWTFAFQMRLSSAVKFIPMLKTSYKCNICKEPQPVKRYCTNYRLQARSETRGWGGGKILK